MSDAIEEQLQGKTLYVVSDLHMGDGTAKDNFAEHRQRFEAFLDEVVEQDDDGRLILAGDVFEFWQSPHGDIVRTYLDLLKRLVQRRAVFIVGNHDIDLLGFVGLPVESALIDHLVADLVVDRGGKESLRASNVSAVASRMTELSVGTGGIALAAGGRRAV